jgi:hypothetical protein
MSPSTNARQTVDPDPTLSIVGAEVLEVQQDPWVRHVRDRRQAVGSPAIAWCDRDGALQGVRPSSIGLTGV